MSTLLFEMVCTEKGHPTDFRRLLDSNGATCWVRQSWLATAAGLEPSLKVELGGLGSRRGMSSYLGSQ